MISRWYILIRSIVMACLTALLAVAMPAAAADRDAGARTLIVLGDSLSAAHNIPAASGWVQLLQERLRPHGWQVVNASISGETSGGGAARIATLLQQHQPQALVVELGGNDGLRGLPIAQFRANLRTIIEQARQAGVNVLLAGIRIPTNYGPLYRRRFEAVYTELSEQFHVPLVPFLLENIVQQQGLMQSDGIHPTAEAQPLIVDNLWPYLAPVLDIAGDHAGNHTGDNGVDTAATVPAAARL